MMKSECMRIKSGENSLFILESLSKVSSETACLFLNPFTHEINRLQFFHQQVRNSLHSLNIPTMKFDYSGTGDSTGGLESLDLKVWLADSQRALAYLTERHGAKKVIVFGVGLGGTFALQLASSHPHVKPIVIDPITNGHEYLLKLSTCHQNMLTDPGEAPFAKTNPEEFLGYTVPMSLQTQIRNIVPESLDSLTGHALITDEFLGTLPEGLTQQSSSESLGLHDMGKLKLQYFPMQNHSLIMSLFKKELK